MAFGAVGFGLFLALRNNAVKYLNDGYMTDYLGNKATDKGGPWGGRIGEGEHCLNLTLPMKQAMIYHRPNLEDKTSFLGKDMGGGGGTGQPANMQVDWNQIIKIGEYYVYKNDKPSIPGIVFSLDELVKFVPAKVLELKNALGGTVTQVKPKEE